MSSATNRRSSSGNTSHRRPTRRTKASRKLQDIQDDGQDLPPGVASPDAEMGPPPVPSLPTARQHQPNVTRPRKKNSKRPLSPEIIPRAPDGTLLPSFGPDTFTIYDWGRPLPTSFHDLSESRRSWKVAADKTDAETYIDDGSDDWCEVDGKSKGYPGASEEQRKTSMYYCVARIFVNRAKCAFRAGQPWADFELAEMAIDLQGIQDGLSNRLRLAIFDVIKARLCNEIWSEQHPSQCRSAGRKKVDSKFTTPAPSVEPEDERVGDPSLEVAGWLKDGDDEYATWHCIYRDDPRANDPDLIKK